MRIFIPNYLLFAITIVVNHAINLNINNYLSFAVNGCIVSIVCFAVGGIANYIANPECIKIVKKLLKKISHLYTSDFEIENYLQMDKTTMCDKVD